MVPELRPVEAGSLRIREYQVKGAASAGEDEFVSAFRAPEVPMNRAPATIET